MRVLVADDDRAFRGTLKRVMETRHFRIWEAGDGEEAVEFSRSLRPDLIMMDLSMPRMDGLEATRIIKAEQPDVRIVVCTVHNEPVYRRAASLNGADAFVAKSRCFSELDFLESLVRNIRQPDAAWQFLQNLVLAGLIEPRSQELKRFILASPPSGPEAR